MNLHRFSQHFPHLSIVEMFEYCAIFGGVEEHLSISFFDNIYDTIEDNLIKHFDDFDNLIAPEFIKEPPFSKLLHAVTRSDAKKGNCFKKAHLPTASAEEILQDLIDLDVLELENSREPIIKKDPHKKLKKELRRHRVQSKIRFVEPYYRFYFGYLHGQKENIQAGKLQPLFENFSKNIDKFFSYPFEQITTQLLQKEYDLQDWGTYWDKDNEFDVYANTKEGKLIVGECKYKERRVCKNELTKLQKKCEQSGIKPDIYLLASKSGFSKELEGMSKEVILYDMESFKRLLA